MLISAINICCWGLWQINALPGRPPPSQLVDPYVNAKQAFGIWTGQAPSRQWSLAKWQVWGEGKHKPFMADARAAVQRQVAKQKEAKGSSPPFSASALKARRRANHG